MRDIKFRGKRIDNGEWVYGSLVVEYDGTTKISYWKSILTEPENDYKEPVHFFEEVHPKTVGQFTGLKDKEGKEILEGDILNCKTTVQNNMAKQEYQEHTSFVVEFKKSCFIDKDTEEVLYNKITSIVSGKCDYKIIGNIHDNPIKS